jgi:hypothetical protein
MQEERSIEPQMAEFISREWACTHNPNSLAGNGRVCDDVAGQGAVSY